MNSKAWLNTTASGLSGTTLIADMPLPMKVLNPFTTTTTTTTADDTANEKPTPSPPPPFHDDELPPPVTAAHHHPPYPTNGPGKSTLSLRSSPLKTLKVHWQKLKKRVGEVDPPASSNSSEIDDARTIPDAPTNKRNASHNSTGIINNTAELSPPQPADNEVDEVVVDRIWSEDLRSSDHDSPDEKSGHPASSLHNTNRKANSNTLPTNPNGTNNNDVGDLESLTDSPIDGFWGMCWPLIVLRWRVYEGLKKFFNTSFEDPKAELHYRQEAWSFKKNLAVWAGVWFLLNWILGAIFARSTSPTGDTYLLTDIMFYFVVAPIFSIPILFMVLYNVPRDHPLVYQSILIISVWIWSFYQVLYMVLCDFYGNPRKGQISCGSKDFIGIFYYTTAMQTIALFGLKLQRLPATIGATVFFVFSCVSIIPEHVIWIRSMINFAVYHAFLIFVHYQREVAERRLYRIRDELKRQYKVTYRAQQNERRTAESKRKLTSYVFHEVRVPLNTALLATQNMAASGTIMKDQEIELNALIGSLNIMSKVLNDVLDFNRMDSGKLESLSRPYAFHQVMRSHLEPMRITTDSRGIDFSYEFDPNIDLVARAAAYTAMGESKTVIQEHIKAHPDVDGVVTGDETRLRQVITNLASNSCKFTPPGGRLTITTKLILPPTPDIWDENPSEPSATTASKDEESSDANGLLKLSSMHLNRHNLEHSDVKAEEAASENMIVRIEVTDTGYGIPPDDIRKLFSAFNQTEQGRTQGGKGTGLGLALVRQIVQLSHGRLGVRSKVGHGSTFWVELPLGIGAKTLIPPGNRPELETSSSNASTDVGKIRAAAISGTVPQMMERGAVSVAVDAAAAKASRPISEDVRSATAIHGLLEQRGRVDFVIGAHSRSSTIPTEDGGGIPLSPEAVPPDKPTRTARPTFVQMPIRDATLIMDPNPTRMSVSSNTSNGSARITNLVQFDQANGRSSPSAMVTATPLAGDPLNVLVVDDDHMTRLLMQRILNRLGCKVTVAQNGSIALTMITGTDATPASDSSSAGDLPLLERSPRPAPFDIVFLDNQMPVMSGLEMIKHLRSLDRKDFVVGCTGNALSGDQEAYKEAGVDQVLTKPVFERSLKEMLVIAEERRLNRKRKSLAEDTAKSPTDTTSPQPKQQGNAEPTLEDDARALQDAILFRESISYPVSLTPSPSPYPRKAKGIASPRKPS